MTTNDDQLIAWARMNRVLDVYGEGPEYRKAWAEWEAAARAAGRLPEAGE